MISNERPLCAPVPISAPIYSAITVHWEFCCDHVISLPPELLTFPHCKRPSLLSVSTRPRPRKTGSMGRNPTRDSAPQRKVGAVSQRQAHHARPHTVNWETPRHEACLDFYFHAREQFLQTKVTSRGYTFDVYMIKTNKCSSPISAQNKITAPNRIITVKKKQPFSSSWITMKAN